MSKNTKTIFLDGLDCANCALKIENAVKDIDGITHASLDFTTQKLKFEFSDESMSDALIKQVSELTLKIEPDVRFLVEDEPQQKPQLLKKNIGLILGAILFGLALIINSDLNWILYGLSYIFVGSTVVLRAIKNALKGNFFDENFLMSIATIGAFAIGQTAEGVAVMLFYQVGEFFQSQALDHSRKSIARLMDIRPDYANIESSDGLIKVSPLSVRINDIITIKPGEKVPLDGIVIEGKSFLDTSSITGESLPKEISIDQEIYSGTINKTGLLKVKVTKLFGDSTVSKILDLVENASSKKAPTEQFITRFARVYTPIVVIIALGLALIPPLFIPGMPFEDWIYRALVFLVVSCPCALVISIPLGYFGGIGAASKHGILMKGSNYLEALKDVDTVVFDKTGTLTQGHFSLTQIICAPGFSEREVLEAAAYAESHSNHPLAASVLKAYGDIDEKLILSVEELAGLGISVKTKTKSIIAGNEKLMNQFGFDVFAKDEMKTSIHIAINGKYAGVLLVEDELKNDAKKTIHKLFALGVKRIVMLTGDSEQIGKKIALDLGITEVYTELLPSDKVDQVNRLQNEIISKGKLVFVGDGINDAPVLMTADIGIAMGALGSDAAIEAADIVLMTDEPSKISTAIQLSRFTQRIVLQNIFFAFAVKGLVLGLGAFGLASMWEAVFADVGVALLAVFNALRILNRKID
ncbi:MAG: cadmium-translocating P-type ATPase [Erysipelotrichaceae bacterium]|nr:cadmium-translocating P-type ATPase [Erysipelotrichaceae bacterium]